MATRMERYDKDAYRIVEDDGPVIGMILRMSNGTWCVFDAAERRLSWRMFGNPSFAYQWWQDNVRALAAVDSGEK